ncbi:hypothetical protein LTR78_003258 [Recurvomyces mirabilis]|uniref:Uncharacterized protein n=1 Tax=Recurvomyces mirabilis TaxID=574656 RepID=A0AAE0WSK4_9PEZI|nr:hypothetical protein LTR78_003258 [Recurvomyces mirabilis]KAK5156924.1 hypothetical protein LTS14_004441 [Recurvomyces mirabilis]
MTTSLPHTWTDSRDDGQPFRLFDLPSEIRDIVYLNIDAKHVLPIARWRTVGTTRPYVPVLRLVSRQVKAEYEDNLYRTSALYLLKSSHVLPNLSMPSSIGHMYHSLQEVVLALTPQWDMEADVLAAQVDHVLTDLSNILPELKRVSIRIQSGDLPIRRTTSLRPMTGSAYAGTFDATAFEWPSERHCKQLACAKLAIDDIITLIRGGDDLELSCDFVVASRLYSVNRKVVTEQSLATLMQYDDTDLILWRVMDLDGIIDGLVPWKAASVEFLEAGDYDFARLKERHEEGKAVEAWRHRGWASKTGHQGCDCCNYEK